MNYATGAGYASVLQLRSVRFRFGRPVILVVTRVPSGAPRKTTVAGLEAGTAAGEQRSTMDKLQQQEVLIMLRPMWVDALGVNEDQVSVCPEDNLIDWLKSLGGGIIDELDFDDVLYRLRRQFGVKVSSDDLWFVVGRASSYEQWEREVKPMLTLGWFADWVAEHAQPGCALSGALHQGRSAS